MCLCGLYMHCYLCCLKKWALCLFCVCVLALPKKERRITISLWMTWRRKVRSGPFPNLVAPFWRPFSILQRSWIISRTLVLSTPPPSKYGPATFCPLFCGSGTLEGCVVRLFPREDVTLIILPFQSQAWPVLLSGDDLIAIAQTGTGKTLAYLLPGFIHMNGQPVWVQELHRLFSEKEYIIHLFLYRPNAERNGPGMLVLTPTRELALQVDAECKKYSYNDYKRFSPAVLRAHRLLKEQSSDCVRVRLLSAFVSTAEGTGNSRSRRLSVAWTSWLLPQAGSMTCRWTSSSTFGPSPTWSAVCACLCSRCGTVAYGQRACFFCNKVLDEADRMLDLGFEPQIMKILLDVRPDRQTVMTRSDSGSFLHFGGALMFHSLLISHSEDV